MRTSPDMHWFKKIHMLDNNAMKNVCEHLKNNTGQNVKAEQHVHNDYKWSLKVNHFTPFTKKNKTRL